MTIKSTICFYECPAARHMIEAWEKADDHSPVFNKVTVGALTRYDLGTWDVPMETLIAVPLRDGSIGAQCRIATALIQSMVARGKLYHKTLIFGRVNPDPDTLAIIMMAIINSVDRTP